MAAVADIQELRRRGQMDLRAGIPAGKPVRQGADPLHGRQRAGRRVQAIDADAAPLLVGEIDEVPIGMKAVVAGTDQFRLLDTRRRVRGQTAGFRIEPELRDEIRAGDVLRRFENVVLDARDVRDKGEAVRRIGRDRVRADAVSCRSSSGAPTAPSGPSGCTAAYPPW